METWQLAPSHRPEHGLIVSLELGEGGPGPVEHGRVAIRRVGGGKSVLETFGNIDWKMAQKWENVF